MSRIKAIVMDAVRHALPLIPLYFYHGSISAYLLLTAFDLALGLMLIVGTTRDVTDPTTVDPRAASFAARLTAALILAGFLGGVAAILTIPLGIPVFIWGLHARVDWMALVTQPGFYLPVALMALSAGVRGQLQFEATTRVGELGTSLHAGPIVGDLAHDRRMAKAAYAAQVTLIGVYFGVDLRAERSKRSSAFHSSGALRRAAGFLRCAAGHRAKNFSRALARRPGAIGGKEKRGGAIGLGRPQRIIAIFRPDGTCRLR